MPYVDGRIVHDADTHVMEVPGFLDDVLEARFKPAVARMSFFERRPGLGAKLAEIGGPEAAAARRAEEGGRILLRKNWDALGAFNPQDRTRALDELGFASQLVFTTALLHATQAAEHSGDADLAYGLAAAHDRYIVGFCAADRRLLPTGYVPLMDLERAGAAAAASIARGAKALMIASRCPARHSPSHIALDPVWAAAQEAGLPIVFHVGGGGPLIAPAYFENGLPPVPDFHGGDDNFKSIDYMAICYPPMQTLATMIFDRVLDRFPRLKVGVIEQGASWLPGWMRAMDSAHD